MTAWAGLNLVDLRPSTRFFISGAAGAVGNVAGQLAKARGCRVIGSAESAAKVKFLKEECRFDEVFDYKTGAVLEQLNLMVPDGIDVYFDNMGGEALEAGMSLTGPTALRRAALRVEIMKQNHTKITHLNGRTLRSKNMPRRGNLWVIAALFRSQLILVR